MRRPVMVLLGALVILHIAVLFAGFLSPYDPAEQHRGEPFAPPTRLHFADPEGHYHLLPFVYPIRAAAGGAGYEEDRSRPYPVRMLVDGPEYRTAGILPGRIHLFGVEAPATVFLMGTDEYGRDQFSRLVYGGQISLVAGPLAGALSIGLGLLAGAAAGYYGGWMDEILMGMAELFLSLPWLYLLLAARAFLPLNLDPRGAFLAMVGLLGVIGWARPARLVRGAVMTAKEREYVLAARGFGASDFYLLRRHILPQTRRLLFTQASLLIPHYILAEVTMSFLGLGVNEPAASWGLMLAALSHFGMFSSYWWMWLPALPLLLIFSTYYALANALGRSANLAPIRLRAAVLPAGRG